MIIMHGLFDLRDESQQQQFEKAFERFSAHLHAEKLIVSWRAMQKQAHDGYNSGAPATKYYVSMEFVDMDTAQQCWDVIEQRTDPLLQLHTDVFTRISDYSFFLTRDL